MSGKLDQSLDQIMQDSGNTGKRRAGRPRAGNRRAAQKAKAAIAAPTGGVQKSTKTVAKTGKAPAMAAQRKPMGTGDSKIIISGLPEDVIEKDLKDYVVKIIGPVKSLTLNYGPTGRSRGSSQVVFANPESAAKAVKVLHDVKIDGRALRVEFVHGATSAGGPAAPKSLADRIAKPKNAAKESTKATTKGKAVSQATPGTNGTAAQGKGAKGKKSGRAGRPKKKTADELDAEMMDYFGNEAAPAANGAAAQPAPAANGTEMVDEVS